MKKKLVVHDQSSRWAAVNEIAALPLDKKWRVEISPYRRQRTEEQMGYYHGVVVRSFCDATGHDHEEMHEFLCGECWGWNEKQIMKTTVRRPLKTLTYPKRINTAEMTHFIDWCLAFGARHGIQIPGPSEVSP